MPFRSKKQMKACFASNGFNGKVDCHEWAHETNMKKLKQDGGVNIDVSAFRPKDPNDLQLEYSDVPADYWELMRKEGIQVPNAPKPKKGFNPMAIGLGMQTAGTGLSWLSGIVDRNRQDQYMYNQFSTLGQGDPVPVSNFQPNPYSLYAKYGGSLRKYVAESMKKGGINPAHRGWCTPMTKSTCTGKRRQFALNMKKMARENG